jgi:hypothetical protein
MRLPEQPQRVSAGRYDDCVRGQPLDRVRRNSTGLVIGGSQVYLDLTTERGEEDTVSRRVLGRVFPAVISCGCMLVAGVTLLAQAGGGLYWLVPSVLAAIIFGLINVWVLLVEILR